MMEAWLAKLTSCSFLFWFHLLLFKQSGAGTGMGGSRVGNCETGIVIDHGVVAVDESSV